MNRFLLLIVVALSFGPTNQNQLSPSASREIQPRIFGGRRADRSQFPYQVGLYIAINDLIGKTCGGALISQRFVLTAAHCLFINATTNRENQISNEIVAFFGSYKKFSDYENGHFHFTISKEHLIVHPLFDQDTLLNDIALIRTPVEIPLTRYIQVISLPPNDQSPDSLVGQNVTSSGWGRFGDRIKAKKLQYMVTKVVPHQECTSPDDDTFNNDREICINDPYKSVCKGDSGGPNVITTSEGKKILIGITSHLAFNFTCQANSPQVLTRVSFYLPWIHNHTGISI